MFVTPGSRRFAIALSILTATALLVLLIRLFPRLDRATPKRGSQPNVILIVVDTLRADHLSLSGYSRDTSPHLDRLARDRGVVLDDVRAQAPCTFPSVNSLLTSRSPLEFVGRSAGEFSIPAEIPTIATILGAEGYSTAAVSASPIVRATPSPENPAGGFGAGFARFDESCSWEFAPCVNRRARALVDELRPPFFLYLHYMDPHDPYVLPGARNPRFSGRVPEGPDREHLLAGDVNPFATRLYEAGESPGLDEEEIRFLVGRYDESVHYWDLWFGRLIDDLDRRGLLDGTIVVVASDHGEEFLEHGDLKHCRNLFDTTIKVPLVFLVPGATPRRLSLPATNLDIVPTLLDLVGASRDPVAFEGRSLREWILGGTRDPESVPQYSWWGERHSISDGRSKLIYSTRLRQFSLYRLDQDPEERTDVFASHRREASRLANDLRTRIERDPYLKTGGADTLEAQLKALGYLQ